MFSPTPSTGAVAVGVDAWSVGEPASPSPWLREPPGVRNWSSPWMIGFIGFFDGGAALVEGAGGGGAGWARTSGSWLRTEQETFSSAGRKPMSSISSLRNRRATERSWRGAESAASRLRAWLTTSLKLWGPACCQMTLMMAEALGMIWSPYGPVTMISSRRFSPWTTWFRLNWGSRLTSRSMLARPISPSTTMTLSPSGVVDTAVGNEGGFANPAFTAGYGDDAGVFYLDFVADPDEGAKVSGLIGYGQRPEPWAEAGT